MDKLKALFSLRPVYDKKDIIFHWTKIFEIYPKDRGEDKILVVKIEYTDPSKVDTTDFITYDYFISITGPKPSFDTTPDLSPDSGGNSLSVCTANYADETRKELKEIVEAAKAGEPQRLVIGTGYGTYICRGIAFEYASNVELELREAGICDLCEAVYITDEYELDDFGVGGMRFKQDDFMTTSQLWTEPLFRERDVKAIPGTAVKRVSKGSLVYETLDGNEHELDFDFVTLLPPFSDHPFKALAKDGSDITDTVFAPSGSMKVDADYSGKTYGGWDVEDWPKAYQNPTCDNLFAAGISFASPHQIPKFRSTPNGTPVTPVPLCTGQPSGAAGRVVAEAIVSRIRNKDRPAKHASTTEMGASCATSTGASPMSSSATAVIIYPIVPDKEKYPLTKRHPYHTHGEIGLFGHWARFMLHYLFIHKAKGRIGQTLIPE